MESALIIHRLHFAFTATFHYLFPQLTMGLAPMIVVLKVLALRRPDRRFDEAARLLARLFAINFVFGVVTGVPMEFQFGTNWARFSKFAGGVRHRWPGGLLPPAETGQRRSARLDRPAQDGRRGGGDSQPVAALPHRRSTGTAPGAAPAGHAGRHGGPVRHPPRRAGRPRRS